MIIDYFKTSFFSNKNGETSLHVAARYGHAHVVEHLCKLGGNVDCQDDVSVMLECMFCINIDNSLGRRNTFDCCCLARLFSNLSNFM